MHGDNSVKCYIMFHMAWNMDRFFGAHGNGKCAGLESLLVIKPEVKR
jgi:hypothetical protein